MQLHRIDSDSAYVVAFDELDEVRGVAVVFARAAGRRCARSWKILPEVGSDPEYPDLSLRDAEAMRERKAAGL